MKLYQQYIAKLTLNYNLVIAFFIIAIIWIMQSFRFLDLIVEKHIGLSNFFSLTLLLLPPIIFLILPIVTFIGVLFSYNRLYHFREANAYMALGLSYKDLIKPAIFASLVFVIISYVMSLYFVPWSNQKFDEKKRFLQNNYVAFSLQEGVFNHLSQDLTIYISHKADNDYQDIFINDSRNNEQETTISAEKGSFLNLDGAFFLKLYNGSKYLGSKDDLTIIDFQELMFDISVKAKNQEDYGLTVSQSHIKQILFPSRELGVSKKIRMIAEGNYRLLWPLANIFAAFFAAFIIIGTEFSRFGKSKIIYKLSIFFIIFVSSFMMLNIKAQSDKIFILLEYLLLFGSMGTLALIIYKKG